MKKALGIITSVIVLLSLLTFPGSLVLAGTSEGVPDGPSNAGFVNVLAVDSTAFPDVVVYVTVDTDKGMAGNLTADDFRIYENNVPQRIVSLGKSGTSTRALDVVFLIDTSGSMDDEIGVLRDRIYSIASNLSEAGYDVRFSVVGFEREPRLYMNFISNVSQVRKALSEIHVSGGTENNFYALEWVLNMSFRPLASKIIVDITDEDDDTQWINVTQVANDLIENNVLFIGISDPREDRGTPESVMNLTERVGGLWIDIHSGDFGEVLDYLVNTLRMTYRIHYVSSNPVMDGSSREVRVSVEEPDVGVAWDTHLYRAPYEEPVVVGARVDSNNSLKVDLTAVVGKSYLVEGKVLNYTWSFGDGNVETVSTPQPYSLVSHIYSESGIYNVTLVVKRVDGVAWDLIGTKSIQVRVVNASEEDERAYRALKALGEWIDGYLHASNLAAPGTLEEISMYDRFEGLNPPLPVKFPDLLPMASVTYLASGTGASPLELSTDEINWLVWSYLPRIRPGKEKEIWSKLGDPIQVSARGENGVTTYTVTTPAAQYVIEALNLEGDVGVDSMSLPSGMDFISEVPRTHVRLEGLRILPADQYLEGRSRTTIPILISAREIETTAGRTHVSQFGPVVLKYPSWVENHFDKTFYIEPFDFTSIYSMSAGVDGNVQASIGFKFLKATLAMGMSLELEIPVIKALTFNLSALELEQAVSMSVEGSLGDEDVEDASLSAEAKISRGSSVPLTSLNSFDRVLTYEKVSWLYYLYTVSPVFKKKLLSWLIKVIDANPWVREDMEFSSGAEFSALDNGLEMGTSTNLYPKGAFKNDYSYSETYPLDLPSKEFKKKFEVPEVLRPRIYGVELSAELELSAEVSPSLEITVRDPPKRDQGVPVSVAYLGDAPVDEDNDGLYDSLRLTFKVRAPAGNYTLVASISKGDEVVAAESVEFNGTSVVSVDIPGQYIVEDGPYDVGFVVQGDGGMGWNFSVARTGEYRSRDFEHFAPNVASKVKPFDLDGDGLYDGINVTLTGNVVGDNVTLEPALSKPGWVIYLDNVSLKGRNWFVVSGYHVRKLSGNFEVVGYLFRDGVFLGAVNTKIGVDPRLFESDKPVITYVGPYSLDNAPAVKVKFTPVGKSNVSVVILYSVGGRDYTARAHVTALNGDSIEVPLDKSPFVEFGTYNGRVREVFLRVNGTTVDVLDFNREFNFDFLPSARIYTPYSELNGRTVELIVPVKVYEPLRGTLVAVLTSGNITRIGDVSVALKPGEATPILANIDLSVDLSGMDGVGRVELYLFDERGILQAKKEMTVDISALVPPAGDAYSGSGSSGSTDREDSLATIFTMSRLWTAWFLKYYETFEELSANLTVEGNESTALLLHRNATSMMLHAWNVSSVEELKAFIGKKYFSRVPRFWEIRKAYLLEKEAVEILSGKNR